jgi:hypothetical protein
MKLEIVHVKLADANAFVARHHRHHKPVPGHKYSIGVESSGVLVGVAIIGRPVARLQDDGLTLEVNRVATDGTKNACSILYGAARRACFALGFKRLITYTLPSEGGASLRGAGWKLLGSAGGGKWSRTNRLRDDDHPTQTKLKWEATTTPHAETADGVE